MAVVTESHELHEHEKRRDLAWLLLGVSALIVALAFLVLVVWQIGASVKATPFDADGVRCYRAASELVCIKTAEPPR